MKSAQTNLSELVNGGKAVAAGARALARFNAHLHATQEMSEPLALRTLKRRERRAPSRLVRRASVLECAGPPALFTRRTESGRGLPQSKTSRDCGRLNEFCQ